MIDNELKDWWDPAIHDSYNKVISIDDKYINLEIIDTGGMEEWMWQWNGHYDKPQQNLFLLIYSIDNMTSFKFIEKLLVDISRAL